VASFRDLLRLGRKEPQQQTPPAIEGVEDPFNLPYHVQIDVLRGVLNRMAEGRADDIDRLLASTLTKSAVVQQGGLPYKLPSAFGGVIGINDYGFKGRRQYIADRRFLLDLYVIAYNNADIRTAMTHQRNEIFRRGIRWRERFAGKCPHCGKEFSSYEARKLNNHHVHVIAGREVSFKLRPPDPGQKDRLQKIMEKANYFGQSLETVLRECWDDINVVDDAFLFISKEYRLELTESGPKIVARPVYVFRLDPVLVEFDLDHRGIPGMRHHVCLFHRENLLDVPTDEGWEIEWRGTCPIDGLPTFPVVYKYYEQYLHPGPSGHADNITGTASPQGRILYLTGDEVIHWSYYSPSELFGYPPVLSIYEKALTLIGMDRYLYDYFYERRVPQGIISTVTDDPRGLEAIKAELQSRMAQDPHYIPWIAVSSKTGAGKTEFVRFAYSLDELNYLPVREEIRERIAGIYGVSQIWMSSSEGVGGLNSERQQLVVMSRVVEGAQRVFHEQVFPPLLKAFGITDWVLELVAPEEADELADIQIRQAKADWARTIVSMGFGVEYDQELDQYTVSGRVASQEEIQKLQMQQQAMPALGGGIGSGSAASGIGQPAPTPATPPAGLPEPVSPGGDIEANPPLGR
jgi:hypothetical protein